MAQAQEHNETPVDNGATRDTSGSGAPAEGRKSVATDLDRVVARLSEDGLSVEIVRYVGAELVELRAYDPAHALRFAAQIADAGGAALRNRARLGLAGSVA